VKLDIINFTGIPASIKKGIANAPLYQIPGGLVKCRVGPVVVSSRAQNLPQMMRDG
jgi:hypothetical protein